MFLRSGLSRRNLQLCSPVRFENLARAPRVFEIHSPVPLTSIKEAPCACVLLQGLFSVHNQIPHRSLLYLWLASRSWRSCCWRLPLSRRPQSRFKMDSTVTREQLTTGSSIPAGPTSIRAPTTTLTFAIPTLTAL